MMLTLLLAMAKIFTWLQSDQIVLRPQQVQCTVHNAIAGCNTALTKTPQWYMALVRS